MLAGNLVTPPPQVLPPLAIALEPAVYRVSSIDLLRGVVMIIMALDHTRDYFHGDAMFFDPSNLEKTNPILFFTRWITHFCAPVFVFLAGTGAFLSGQRKSKRELSMFLLTRGLWMIVVEIFISGFGWGFNIEFPWTGLQVLWALGISMIALAGLIHFSPKVILSIGILIVLGHNMLDGIHVDTWWWSALHETRIYELGANRRLRFSYPVLPWIGIMALGYCLGTLYKKEVLQSVRKKWLLIFGLSVTVLFIILRAINIYGDPQPWSQQPSWSFTLLSFLNTAKYPPSLLYTLMTLGPSMIFLAFTENVSRKLTMPVIHFGRVPMFYYIVHIYLIHLLAMVAAELSGFHWYDMILERRPQFDPQLKGYGFSLLATYFVWIGVVLMLYPLCKWYDEYKTAHKDKWWLSYL